MEKDGIFIEVKKLGRNSRRIHCKFATKASLEEVWRVFTAYERMTEIFPSICDSKILERRENFVRLSQVGQQDLAFGFKLNPKAVMEYYERDVEVFDCGKRRNMEFKMVEGELPLYEGKWTVEQLNKGCETTISYVVDIKTKLWLPIQLIEGKFSEEILATQSCMRDEVMTLIQNAQPSP